MNASANSNKRNVVIHQDDVGMCHGANVAFVELSRLGVCNAGSVMVPCPWFLEIAEAAAGDSVLDLGVHLTLTSEKRHYKWRPLTAPSAAAGLTDPYGYFWPDVASLRQSAAPDAVEAEMRAQIETALATGIDVTHLDAHMGAALAPEFRDIYISLGREYALPVLLTPSLADYGPLHNLEDIPDEQYRGAVQRARELGFPIFDKVVETPWTSLADIGATYRTMIDDGQEGWTFYSFHFNAPGDVEAIDPDGAGPRIAEYELFQSADFRNWLLSQQLNLTGFRQIRDELRSAWAKQGAEQ